MKNSYKLLWITLINKNMSKKDLIVQAHLTTCHCEAESNVIETWTDFFYNAIPARGYAPDYAHGFFFEYYPDGVNGNYELWTPVVKADA